MKWRHRSFLPREGGATPQELAEIDARRLLTWLHRENVPMLTAAYRILKLLGRMP